MHGIHHQGFLRLLPFHFCHEANAMTLTPRQQAWLKRQKGRALHSPKPTPEQLREAYKKAIWNAQVLLC